MKKQITIITLTLFGLLSGNHAYAQFSLSDLGNIGKIVEGIFTKTDLQVSDLAGVWTVTGSAVAFQSENLLKKAGGATASATIESKIDPYFKQFGLTGGVFTIESTGEFTFKMSKMSLSGTIMRNDDGTFTFTFKALGKVSLGGMKTYVQKTSSTMDIMFDAKKLETILSTVGGISGIKALQTISSLLSNYEGICIGFGTTKTGSAQSQSTKPEDTSGSGVGSLLDALKAKVSGN